MNELIKVYADVALLLDKVKGRPITEELISEIRMTVRQILHAAYRKPDVIRFEVSRSKEDPRKLRICFSQEDIKSYGDKECHESSNEIQYRISSRLQEETQGGKI